MMLILVFVFTLIIVAFHIYYNWENRKEDTSLLYWVANVGSISDEQIEKFYDKDENQTNDDGEGQHPYACIVAIKYDENGKLLSFESTENLSLDEKGYMLQIGEDILSGKHFIDKNINYKLVNKEYGSYLVMINTTGTSFVLQYSEYLFAGGILIVVLGILFVISFLLSYFVTKPAEDSINKQKQFVSDASHELKTPLAAIMLNAEAMRATNEGNQNLANILSEASRMEKLIRNLLELAKADDVSNKLIIERFNLSEAILQISLPFESEAYESRIRFETSIAEGVFYYGSSDDIKQVIAILIDNAFKHTNEGGKVAITLDSVGNNRKIVIFNTGNGISEKDLPHIFERFYSCDQSRNGRRQGYGLGLAIAKAIIEKHNGTIKVKSEYGKYAEFTINLPLNGKHR